MGVARRVRAESQRTAGVIAQRVMDQMLLIMDVARRVPVGTHGNPEGVRSTLVMDSLVPNSFALQDLVIPALAPEAQAAARLVPAIARLVPATLIVPCAKRDMACQASPQVEHARRVQV
jgi:hypothetical protein